LDFSNVFVAGGSVLGCLMPGFVQSGNDRGFGKNNCEALLV